jgi:Kef-type K+ transport system membrane component KefB
MQPATNQVDETEQRVLPAPARGVTLAIGLAVAAAALLAIGVAAGWLNGHPAAAGHHAPAAPSPVQLLWRVVLAIAVIAALARVCGWLARLIRQPAVVGEIAAGLILGPTVLRTFAPSLFHALLPAPVLADLGPLAQAGLVIFMFAVGLGVDRDMLRQHGKVILASSQAMMIVPFVVGLLAAVPLYVTFAGHGTGLVPYAAFVGTALSVTAFPVLARIVEESGLRATRLGTLAMLCAAVCDVLAWCALAVVLAMTKSQGPLTVLRTLALIAALAAVVLLVVRPLLRMLTERYADAAVPASLLLILIVLLIVGLGAATDKIGVHDIFGGFLAGLAVPRDSRLLRPVIGRIDTLNRGLLLPVFFVSIGLQVNVWHAVAKPAVLGGGLLLLAVAVVAKFGGTTLVAAAGGMPRRSALGLGALMNTRGVTDIVVISTGLSIGVINGNAFTMLILMALITTMMAGPALRLLGLWRPGGADAAPAPSPPATLPAGGEP